MPNVSSRSDLDLDAAVAHDIFLPIPGFAPPATPPHHTKISVIGAGHVGMAIAQTILTQSLANELALVDSNPSKLLGERLDLQHAAAFLPRTRIATGSGYDVTEGSDVVVIAAGARRRAGETREDLLGRNVEVFREVVPAVAERSPEAVLIVVSNPVDVLAYVAWKLSGFPANRVIGSGTNLDSSRFRFMLAEYLKVNAQDIQAYMVGEHGDKSVALWSSISVGGVPILSYITPSSSDFEQEVLERIRRAVVDSAHEVVRLKGYTSWAIGYSVASLVRSILRDQRLVHPVSLLASGCCGIGDDKEVFLSLPAQLGTGGVVSVVHVHLTEAEGRRLRESAEALWEVEERLGL